MNYFKYDGVVIRSEVAPVVPGSHGLDVIVNGWVVPLTSITSMKGVQGLVVQNLARWEKATEMDFLVYQSKVLNLISHQDAKTIDLIDALNSADKTALRLGMNGVNTKQPLPLTRVSEKVAIISQTQHFEAEDLPSVTKDSNSTWTNWVINKRREQPFIFIGKTLIIEGGS